MIKQINIIPELNFWMRQELKNSQVYDTYHKIPVDLISTWREPRSVIELLFNENFNAGNLSSSSSSSDSIEADNDKPYIYKYRRVNLLNITDKILLNRIQPYRWWSNIYAANSEEFLDIFNMQGSHLDPEFYQSAPLLPYDVEEEDRSEYITYQTYNASNTNYPLWNMPDDIDANNNEPVPIIAPPDIFSFADDTFDMLDKLWEYRTTESLLNDDEVDLLDIGSYDVLYSPLAQLIYIYLDAVINDSYIHYDSEDIISGSNSILCTLYEKHVIDMLYLIRQKCYGVIWNDRNPVNNEMIDEDEDFFIVLKKQILKINLTEEMIDSNMIQLTKNLPWDRKDLTFYKDGDVLVQDQDFSVSINEEDVYNISYNIVLLRGDFQIDESIELIYSFADPYTPFSEDDS
jgi:hypothetical protein